MLLKLVPREPRFAVRLPSRMSREGAAPFQVALPKALHDRLRAEVAGSLNQALIALARQALAWLDAEQTMLSIDLREDPLDTRTRSAAAKAGWRGPWTYPHPMFLELPRTGAVVVRLNGRPSRSGVVFLQIGLPPDLQMRLHEQGVGSVGQLLVYLARYAFVRLEASGQSLHVNQTTPPSESASSPSEGTGPVHRLESCSVGALMQVLGTYPPETPLLTRHVDAGAGSGSLTISEKRDAENELAGIVLAAGQS